MIAMRRIVPSSPPPIIMSISVANNPPIKPDESLRIGSLAHPVVSFPRQPGPGAAQCVLADRQAISKYVQSGRCARTVLCLRRCF
jgi:hypothetical protein